MLPQFLAQVISFGKSTTCNRAGALAHNLVHKKCEEPGKTRRLDETKNPATFLSGGKLLS
jgi:hypothetical protein